MHEQVTRTQQRRHVGVAVEADIRLALEATVRTEREIAFERTGAGDHQLDVAGVPAHRDRLDERDLVLLMSETPGRDDAERHVRGRVRIERLARGEPRRIPVGNHVHCALVAMFAQQARGHLGGRVDVVDALVQPLAEQPVEELLHTGDVAQRSRGIQDVLRLQMESGGHGDAHLAGDLRGATPEFERHVDVDDVDALERGTEQRVARFGELHLLLCGHPRDERHPVDAGRIFRRADADETHMMSLPFQFGRPLKRRIRCAVALVADRVDHQRNRQRTVDVLLDIRHVADCNALCINRRPLVPLRVLFAHCSSLWLHGTYASRRGESGNVTPDACQDCACEIRFAIGFPAGDGFPSPMLQLPSSPSGNVGPIVYSQPIGGIHGTPRTGARQRRVYTR